MLQSPPPVRLCIPYLPPSPNEPFFTACYNNKPYHDKIYRNSHESILSISKPNPWFHEPWVCWAHNKWSTHIPNPNYPQPQLPTPMPFSEESITSGQKMFTNNLTTYIPQGMFLVMFCGKFMIGKVNYVFKWPWTTTNTPSMLKY